MCAGNVPFAAPIHQSVSYGLSSIEDWRAILSGDKQAFLYASDGNPTVHELELLLAELQGRESALVCSTGKSAIARTLFGLLKNGDHLIYLEEAYRSTQFFVSEFLSSFGISATAVSSENVDAMYEAIQPGRTKVLLLETPTNPLTRICDLEAIVELAQETGIVTVLDNSLGGFVNHGNYPIDIFVHSLSKYASGVSDVMGGAVIGSRNLISQIRNKTLWQADVMDANVAAALLRGMQTYELRFDRQCKNAKSIAEFLESHEKASKVLYPGLESHPDFALAKNQMSYFGSILCFNLNGSEQDMFRWIDGLKLFTPAFGAGFVRSLVSPAQLFYTRGFDFKPTGSCVVSPTTIRLSIGIEDVQELISDLQSAFASL